MASFVSFGYFAVEKNRFSTVVAQVGNLLYRRLAVGWAKQFPSAAYYHSNRAAKFARLRGLQAESKQFIPLTSIPLTDRAG